MNEYLSFRMDKWIDSRLSKLKNENRQISTNQILVELMYFFKIKVTKKNERAIKAKVNKIRNRIDKRHERKLKFYKQMAMDLVVPVSLVDRWVRKGWIMPGKRKQSEKLVSFVRELGYYHNFEPDVPENIETPLWSD